MPEIVLHCTINSCNFCRGIRLQTG